MKKAAFALLSCAAVVLPGLPARADRKAEALLKQVMAAEKAVRTLTADVTVTMNFSGRKRIARGMVRLKKPNLARIETSGPMGQTIASDGKTVWMLMKATNQYQKQPADVQTVASFATIVEPVAFFFNRPVKSIIGNDMSEVRYVGVRTIEGVPYKIIESRQEAATRQFFIGPDNLVHRSMAEYKQGDRTMTMQSVLKNLRVNRSLARSAFAYTPPKTAKLYQEPNYEAKLIPVGRSAPDFSLPTPEGGALSLENTRKDKKAVLVNFWAYF